MAIINALNYCHLHVAGFRAKLTATMNAFFTSPRGRPAEVLYSGLASLIVCIFTSAQAQVVAFPDANLEAAVRDALHIPAPTKI
jgi:hypothetical protein